MAGLGAAAGLAVAADLLQPVLPALRLLALLAAAGFAITLIRPSTWTRGAARLAAGLGILALLQAMADQPRGLLAGSVPQLAAWQQRALRLAPHPWDPDRLRAALSDPAASLRPEPASADEALFNALLLALRRDVPGASSALAQALRLDPAPRPDSLLLGAELLRRPGAPPLPGDLPSPLPELLHALALAEPAARVAALDPLVVAEPDNLVAAAALAQARIAAMLPRGPTIAEAGGIAVLLAPFDDAERLDAFEASFLDPRRAAVLRQGVAALGWAREVAGRRLEVATLLPPPGMPDQPALLRLAVPEPASAVQLWQDDAWVAVGAEESPPTLRLPRPFRPTTLRLRYLDRDGVASAEVAYRFDPAAALRAQAQRSLARQHPFALYQPGWIEPSRLNPLPIPGHLRAGLAAVEWRTDAEPRPQRLPVGVTDAALLAGDPARILVEFPASESARLLVLRAILADGTEAEPVELAIR
ncbi:hypothetical protein ACLF3G_23055 [Falsiroseomonas sp. HC035]|uniref:hypothetical protein n=1 Tax=Falsiroseomonas sp. HC035 TaxID=3390999 RepID=UPI003D31F464